MEDTFGLILGALLGVGGTLIVIGAAVGIKKLWRLIRKRGMTPMSRDRAAAIGE